MTYYPDLSPYEFIPKAKARAGISSLNVGWLDPSHPFPIGETSPAFRAKLYQHCQHHVLLTRCFHLCELHNCPSSQSSMNSWDPISPLGSSEIRVIGPASIYAAPVMIYHYVVVHSYRPPDEFIEAVMTSPAPDSQEYQSLRQRLGEADA